MQISGHIITETGKKVIALAGKWNSHLDMVKCDEEGDPIKGAETTRLWEVGPLFLSPMPSSTQHQMCSLKSLSSPLATPGLFALLMALLFP